MSDKKMSDVFDLPLSVSACGYEVKEIGHVGGIDCQTSDEAEAIAHAVNSHDKLVEALNQMHDRANTYGECLEIAEQALQAIKGEQRED